MKSMYYVYYSYANKEELLENAPRKDVQDIFGSVLAENENEAIKNVIRYLADVIAVDEEKDLNVDEKHHEIKVLGDTGAIIGNYYDFKAMDVDLGEEFLQKQTLNAQHFISQIPSLKNIRTDFDLLKCRETIFNYLQELSSIDLVMLIRKINNCVVGSPLDNLVWYDVDEFDVIINEKRISPSKLIYLSRYLSDGLLFIRWWRINKYDYPGDDYIETTQYELPYSRNSYLQIINTILNNRVDL